jgi:dienelactone hydrolase
MTIENWEATGRACMEWLLRRQEVDPQRVAISGRSFGSFATTLAASNEPRFRAVAVSATCFEPGFGTIFEEASPTFKMRFMFMANISDETAFDEFANTLTWEGRVEKIHMSFLCIAGGSDELSPIARFHNKMCPEGRPLSYYPYRPPENFRLGPSDDSSIPACKL